MEKKKSKKFRSHLKIGHCAKEIKKIQQALLFVGMAIPRHGKIGQKIIDPT